MLTKVRINCNPLIYPPYFILIVVSLFITQSVLAQQDGCENISFENGNLDFWDAGEGCQPGADWRTAPQCNDFTYNQFQICCQLPANPQQNIPSVVPTNIISYDWEVTTQRHVVYTVQAMDPLSGINVIPPPIDGLPVVNSSLRLGNADNGSQADMIQRTIAVTEANAIFMYEFVFVLNDPRVGHADDELPYLSVTVTDESDRVIECISFKILANDPAFDRTPSPNILMSTGPQISGNLGPAIPNAGQISAIDWTPVFGNFTDYIGQNINLRIEVGDCGRSGHFGYAYIANRCLPYNAMQDTTICAGDTVMLVSPFTSVGYDLLWSTGETSDTIYVAPTQTQTITLSVTNRTIFRDIEPCTEEYDVTISILPGEEPDIDDITICKGDDGTLTAMPLGTPYDWFADENSPNPVFNGNTFVVQNVLNDTTFWIKGQGCGLPARYPVTIFVDEVIADAGPDQHICVGGGTPLNASGGTNYLWEPDDGTLSNLTIANPVASPVVPTTYIVTVSNDLGCEDKDTVEVLIDTIVADVTPDDTICPGEFVQLQATGGTIFSWTPATGLDNPNIGNPIATPTNTTRYVVTVRDEAGCVDYDTVTIYAGGVTVDIGEGGTICAGNSVQLQASGGLFYFWEPGESLNNQLIPNPIASPTVTTTYNLTIAGALGCEDSAEVTVVVDQLEGEISEDDTICIGNSTTISASGGVNYEWIPQDGSLSNNTIANPVASPDETTEYTVYISDDTGFCRDTLAVTVFVDRVEPDAGVGATICAGGSTSLLASGGGTYDWSPKDGSLNATFVPNPIASPTTPTTYTVTVTSEWGFCVGSDTVSVRIGTLDANVSPDDTICLGDQIQIQATGGTVYSWTPADLAIISEFDIANPIVFPTVTTTFVVDVTDNGGICSDQDSVTIYVESITPDISADTAICAGESITIQASGGDVYVWTPANLLTNPNSPTQTVSPTSTTRYFVNIANTSGVCEADLEVEIEVNDISVSIDDVFLCPGFTTTLDPLVTNTSADGEDLIFSWSPATDLSADDIRNPVLTGNTSGVYELNVTNASGCEASDDMTLTVAQITASIDPVDPICQGDTARLNASGGLIYEWTPTTNVFFPDMEDPLVRPFATTTYTVKVSDASGQCSETASVLVEVLIPSAEAGPDKLICSGGSVMLEGSGEGDFLWSPADILDDATSSTPLATPIQNPTTVYLTISDGLCSASDSVLINISNNSVSATADPALILEGEITNLITRTPGDSIIWTIMGSNDQIYNGPFDPDVPVVVLPDSSTTYQVISVSELGCLDTANVPVIVLPPIIIPNVFTPNDDDLNDTWEITNIENFIRAEIRIYNRWGSVVYQYKGIYEGDFDGNSSRGAMLPVGTYYFVIDLNFRNLSYGGDVTILR